MRVNKNKKVITLGLVALSSLVSFACGANDGILKSGKANTQANARTVTPLEEDLAAMRTAGFSFVYVLRRKDGGPIDAEDKGVIKANTASANRRVSSDDDKAFVIGSNIQIPPDDMMAIYARFAVENYSPEPTPEANANK